MHVLYACRVLYACAVRVLHCVAALWSVVERAMPVRMGRAYVGLALGSWVTGWKLCM